MFFYIIKHPFSVRSFTEERDWGIKAEKLGMRLRMRRELEMGDRVGTVGS